MNSAEFHSKYQLLQQVTDGDVATHHAVAVTGAVVMVHLVSADARDLLADLDMLSAAERSRIIEVTELDGAPVVVTKFILNFASLGEWLGSAPRYASAAEAKPTMPLAESVPLPGPQPPDVPERAPAMGEFTRRFKAQDASLIANVDRAAADSKSPIEAPPPPDADPPPTPRAPSAAPPPGEFTRLFPSVARRGPEVPAQLLPPERALPAEPVSSSADRDAPEHAPAPPEPYDTSDVTTADAPPAPPASELPCESVRGAAPPAAGSIAPGAATGPGEFTLSFPPPVVPPRDIAPPPTAPPDPPAPRSGAILPEPFPAYRPPPPPPPSSDSYLDRLHAEPAAGHLGGGAGPDPRSPVAPPFAPTDLPAGGGAYAPPPRTAPGEYTRMVSAQRPPPIENHPSTPQFAPPAEHAPPRKPFLIAIGTVVVLALALFLFFALLS